MDRPQHLRQALRRGASLKGTWYLFGIRTRELSGEKFRQIAAVLCFALKSRMPRKQRTPAFTGPISIGARYLNKERFPIPMDDVWEIMSDYLYYINMVYQIQIHQFVLMNNHWHLMASAPNGDMSLAMQCFMRETSLSIASDAGRINQIYGGRHFRSEIHSHHYFLNAYKYFYRNPVEAGISKTVESYPYSTLSGLLGFRKMSIPVIEDVTLFSNVEGTLRWLNESPAKDDIVAVRRALRHGLFKLPRHGHSRKPHELETRLL